MDIEELRLVLVKRGETKAESTQTEPLNYNTARDGVTTERIRAVQNYEDFKIIKKENWPNDIFVKSRHVEGSITQAGKEVDILVWDEGDSAGPQTKRVLGKYPELETKKGEYAQLCLTTKMRNSKGNESKKEQVVTQMGTDGSERHCYEQASYLKNRDDEERKEGNSHIPAAKRRQRGDSTEND